MGENADEVDKLKAKIARLEAKSKQKKRLDDSYVLRHEDQFIQLLEVLRKFKTSTGERYFHTRKARIGSTDEGKEQRVFKLNLLIEDLLEFKARTNVDSKDLPVRLSMDKGALIDFLQKGRVKRKDTH